MVERHDEQYRAPVRFQICGPQGRQRRDRENPLPAIAPYRRDVPPEERAMSTTIPTIALIRETSLLTDALVQAIVPALQTQIDRDWVPHWGGGATVLYVPPGAAIPGDAWRITLMDTSDDAGALGYHETTPSGHPCGIVAVGDCIRDQLNWNVTVSHELLEMLADPEITKVQQVTIDGVTYDYAYEVCDACEDDQFAYNILGHQMSDFVLPPWFGGGPGPYDSRGVLNAPLQLGVGGYIGRRLLPDGAWSQLMAREIGPRALNKGVASRTMRRFRK
jgi:hypothetical protein